LAQRIGEQNSSDDGVIYGGEKRKVFWCKGLAAAAVEESDGAWMFWK